MSIENAIHSFESFFTNLLGHADPTVQAQAQTAVDGLHTAASAAENLIPQLAETGADAALAAVLPVAATPIAAEVLNPIIDALINALLGRKAPVPLPVAPAG